MEKAVRVVCLTIAVVVVVLGTPSPGYAQPPDMVTIKLKDDGSGSCEILLKDKGNRFKGVCQKNTNPKKCAVTEFRWTVENDDPPDACGLASWTLVIKNAPGHPECFPDAHHEPWFVAKFTAFDQIRTSGPPSPECSQDKFGTYWPYVISLYDDTGLIDTTDPGGIIFP